MSNMALIVAVASLLGWLALNLASLRGLSRDLGRERVVRMALAWVAIIALAAFVATRFLS